MAGVAALAAAAFAWTLLRPPRRELLVVGLGLLLALAALTIGRQTADGPDLADPDWRAAAGRAYAAVWNALDGEAARAGATLTGRGLDRDVQGDDQRLAAFRALSGLVEERATGEGRWALLLVDPDGEPVAWAGEGLLHELQAQDVPRSGRAFEASFGAVTLLSAAPLDDGRRPWRAVAARSFSTDHLPFGPRAPWLTGSGPRWSLVSAAQEAAPGATLIGLPDAPFLVVEGSGVTGSPGGHMERVAWGFLGLALLLLAAMRGTGLALGAAAVDEPAPLGLPPVAVITVLGAAGAVALGLAVRAGAGVLVSLVAGVALAVAGLALGGRLVRPAVRAGRWLAAAAGAAAVLVLTGATLLAQSLVGALHLSDRVFADPTVFLLRLALAAAAVGLLAMAGATARAGGPGEGASAAAGESRGEGWAWLAAPLLVAGAAVCDHSAAALVLLCLGGAAVALWVGERRPRHPAALAVLLLLASLLAAGVWETAHRRLLRFELVTGGAAFGTAAGAADALESEVEDFFAGADLSRFVPRTPAGLEREDLAFLLWQESPLARPNALSSLTVIPFDGLPSSFSFGVPVGGVDLSRRESWPEPPPVPVAGRLQGGEVTLLHQGEPWAVVEWNLLPLPGFRLRPDDGLARVEAALLRGLPRGASVAGMPEPVVYVHYGVGAAGGGAPRPLVSPWQEEPPLDPALAGDEARVAVVETPVGEAWAVSRPDAAGWEVLYLPLLSPRQALERAGTHALGVLSTVLALAVLALLVALPRAAFRELLRRTVRSYSKRLLLVYTLLLLVPLLLLNALLVATVQDRLRQEQRAAGEAALSSAQQVMADYLASLDPGFDLASAFDDELLRWLSGVLHHEINLYWGSEIWASSKLELFTVRLLPKRIPGESFAGIAYLGHDLAARTNRLGDVSYLELYAPLTVHGAEPVPSNIFLSMPLLAQQEEVARELATLRRQGLLITAALIVLVTAVGVRLSRSFTRPLTELVEGTRRIAAGAPSLDMSPNELELAALVEAVDDMARRIAEGRERLMREKQVVERMVEHVTSGVVSLDREHRVLMRNRVAAELLGVEVGERLETALEGHPRLAPVAGWLQGVGRRTAQRTVRLAPPEADGGGAGEDHGGLDGEADGGGEREWTLVWVPVPGAGEPAALLVVEDVTETLRTQRLEAWAEMARIIAHEIKNPLTPIRLNIEHLQQVWNDRGRDFERPRGFGAVLERCAGNVLAQVDELRQIAGEFSTYSRIPRIEPRPGDLVEAMEELVEPYVAAPPAGVDVALEVGEGPVPARFDRRLLSRAVRNLVENALRASAGGGRVVLRLERRDDGLGGGGGERPVARISVLDCGPGIAPALLPRIFDPYFSTYDTGTGLGLPIARRIAEEHGGSIGARNRPEGGLEVWISLPVTPS